MPYDIQIPILGLFSTWDSGQYCIIALSGYPPGNIPLGVQWAWFPLYSFLIGDIGKIFFGVMSRIEAVMLAGFLLSNTLFFSSLFLFYKLSTKILGNKKLVLLSSIFFCFWPGSLFYSSVYSESLFMTLTLGAFYYLEKGKNAKSTLLGFLAAFTRSNGFLVAIPFLYKGFKKHNVRILIQAALVALPYLLFNLYGYFSTGLFPVQAIAFNLYWEKPPFFLLQLFEVELGYAILYFIEFCLVLVPFVYLFLSKKLLLSVFSLGLKENGEEAKYFGFSLVHVMVLLFYSIVANVHRYAIPILPLYWVFAKIWNKKPKLGVISLLLMITLLIIGTILFSTWRWFW